MNNYLTFTIAMMLAMFVLGVLGGRALFKPRKRTTDERRRAKHRWN